MERLIIFATGNKDKVREVSEILSGSGVRVISMKEAGIDYTYMSTYEMAYAFLKTMLGGLT